MNATFADRLNHAIKSTGSCLVAGFDPVLEQLPDFVLEENSARNEVNADCVCAALTHYYRICLEALCGHVCAIKPNLAFFEQYGLAGLRALAAVNRIARELNMLIIADAKRGDIGSTARAYSAAFLGTSSFRGEGLNDLRADALTVSPFLGFDTLEPYVEDCRRFNRGIFVLTRTSNPGASDLQGGGVSEKIAAWLDDHAGDLMGDCGFSGLGAVVGATHPEEASALRRRMPRTLFLIPGFGAQGASAADAVAGFSDQGDAGIINVSRGLFQFASKPADAQELQDLLRKRAAQFNKQIRDALTAR